MRIETPRGTLVTNKAGTNAKLEWNPGFGPFWNGKYTKGQAIMDSTVLKGCDKYVPMKTGMLKKSGILGTFIGKGEVHYIAPYAKWQYYKAKRIGSETGPLRGPFWFERWKKAEGLWAIRKVKDAIKEGRL